MNLSAIFTSNDHSHGLSERKERIDQWLLSLAEMQAVSANIIAERGANDQAYLIFDNAPGHRNIEEALGETFPIKRLSKYSPFLNLKENAFSCWKNDLKARLAENMHIFLNPDGPKRTQWHDT